MSRNQVVVQNDVSITPYNDENRLHFQWGRFDIGEDSEYGYRFMWSNDRGLKPLRGGARIPSWEALQELLRLAKEAGWADKQEP